jgi:hypothetical protein
VERSALIPSVLFHPLAAVDRYPGRRRWLTTEILPLSFGSEARWMPNYTEHFLGGGMTSRRLGEWYSAHGVPAPVLLGAATTLVAAAVNEVFEYDDGGPVPSSSVADLWFFDLGGVLFFTWDGPARWIQKNLQLSSWSTMGSLTLPNGEIQNNGDYFILKAPLPWLERERLLIRFGLTGQLGIAHQLDAERTLSIAFGADTHKRRIDPDTGQEYIDMRFGAGLYYDRNNSLLASVSTSFAQNRVSVNLYPGLIDRAPFRDLGLWLVLPQDAPVRLGVASRYLLGAGLGFGR